MMGIWREENRLFKSNRFPQDGIPGPLRPFSDVRMDVLQGHDLPQVVRRSQDKHGHVPVGNPCLRDYLIPIPAFGPFVQDPGGPEIEGASRETGFFQASEQGPHGCRNPPAGLVQFFESPSRILQDDLVITVIDEGGDNGSHQRRVFREGMLFDTFPDQQGLVEAQAGCPNTAFRQALPFVHKTFGLQKIQVSAEVVPEAGASFGSSSLSVKGVLVHRQGMFENLTYTLRRLGKEEIENHGKIIPDLALDVFRFTE